MARVVVLGNTAATRHFLRQGLGIQQLEFTGLAAGPDRDLLAYGFEYGSGASRFRGTVEVRDDAVVLAGRYGRGGLRHDTIPFLDPGAADDPATAAAKPDVVVVGEAWDGPVPAPLLEPAPRLVRFGPPGPVLPDAVAVPAAVAWAANTVVDAVRPLAAVTAASVVAVGTEPASGTGRVAALAVRGGAPGRVCHPWPAGPDPAVAGVDVVGGAPEPVATAVVQLAVEQPVEAAAVARRLAAAARRTRLEVRPGPLGSADALGSAAGLVDASAVAVAGRAVVVAVHCDVLTLRAALACDLATGGAGWT